MMVAAHDGTDSMAGASSVLRTAWLRVNPTETRERHHIVMAALGRRRGVPAAIDFCDAWSANCRARLGRGHLPPETIRIQAPPTPDVLYRPICAKLGLSGRGGIIKLNATHNTLRVIPSAMAVRRATACRMPWAELGATAWMFFLADVSAIWRAQSVVPMSVMASTPRRRVYKTRWRVGLPVVVYRSLVGTSAMSWIRHQDNRPWQLPRDFVWVCRGTAMANNELAIAEVNMAHPHALLVSKASQTDVYEWSVPGCFQ
jgi:hypothetical protein